MRAQDDGLRDTPRRMTGKLLASCSVAHAPLPESDSANDCVVVFIYEWVVRFLVLADGMKPALLQHCLRGLVVAIVDTPYAVGVKIQEAMRYQCV